MNDSFRVISVRELNFAVRQLLEKGLPLLWVRGEVSNFTRAASGHWYFSLKDEESQVRCVMFRHKNQYLDWQPKEGSQVEVSALTTLYEPRGEFQLTLEQMRPAGQGALFEAFERLKSKLAKEGLFDASRKQELPVFPRRVGVVTSPQAAALRDVLTTMRLRMPNIQVTLYPVPVQGEGAALKIAQAVETANVRAECDVLIVCRGGGSIEDLWAFNEEVVVRAIAASRISVVTGVGHETDFTIADFVADARAATPTAAAQLVAPDRQELLLHLSHLFQRVHRAFFRKFEQSMQKMDFLQRRLVHPARRLEQQQAHLAHLQQRLQMARPDLDGKDLRIRDLLNRMRLAMGRSLDRHVASVRSMQQHLQHLDPAQVLARGYSVVRDGRGQIVMDSDQIQIGERLDITFAHGQGVAELKEKGGAS